MANKKASILDDLKSDYKDSESVKNENDDNVTKWMKIYDSKPYGNEVPHKSQFVSQMCKTLVGWQVPSLVDPFVSSDDIVECSPVGHLDRAVSEQDAMILNYQYCRDFNRFDFHTDIAQIISKKGTVFIKTGWEFEEKEMTVDKPIVALDPMTQQQVIIGYEQVQEMVTIKNRPTGVICDTLDIRMDPTCKGEVDNASFIIHDFETDLSTLRKDGRYKNLEKIMDSLSRDETYETRETNDDTFEFQDDPRKKFIVHEYWGYYDVDGDGIAEGIICAWVGDVIIRQEENPFPDQDLPFVKGVYSKLTDSIYGEPLAALIGTNQRVDSVLNRGIFDDMKQANNGQTGTKKGFTDDSNKIKKKKGEDFEYNTTMTDVWESKYTPISNSVTDKLSSNKQDAEDQSGVKAFVQGQGGNSLGSTATAVTATTGSAAKRELQIIRGIAENIVIPMLRKWRSYNAEWLEPEEIQAITDKPPVPMVNTGAKNVKMKIETVETKSQKVQSTGFVLQTMGPSMPAEQKNILMGRYLKLIGEPDTAHAVENFKPQPDPKELKVQDLQIAKLEAEVINEQAKGAENRVDVALKTAKTNTEIKKANDLQSDADAKDLKYVEDVNGVSHGRKMEEKEHDRKSKLDEKAFDAINKKGKAE